MIKSKLYLYDSSQVNYRGEDLSEYILQGNGYNEDLSQELDTANITLQGYNRKEEFAPSTKMILDICKVDVAEGEEFENIIYTHHVCVEQDTVTQPILSDDEYYVHTIALVEPSVIAQKRLVDNISATYKLKFVGLQQLPKFDKNEKAPTKNEVSKYTPTNNFYYNEESSFVYPEQKYIHIGKYFEFEGKIEMCDIDDNASDKLYNNYDDFRGGLAYFKLPRIAIYYGDRNGRTFNKVGYASYDYTIQEYNIADHSTPLKTYNGTLYETEEFPVLPLSYSWEGIGSQISISNEYLVEKYEEYSPSSLAYKRLVKKYVDTTKSQPSEFKTRQITIHSDCEYDITVSIHDFDEHITLSATELLQGQPIKESEFEFKRFFLSLYNVTMKSSARIIDTDMTTMHATFNTYSNATTEVMLNSANPYSAMSLIEKAILNTGIYEKQEDYFVSDINARDEDGNLVSKVPFYVDDAFVTELRATNINENFYNEKNLWEVLLEVGNYIHAIPEIRFGEDDKFMITFQRLGSTDFVDNNSTKISIANFKGIEDYVSACSSYINNMVQLGGQIEEFVVPKTNAESYLVHNDSACIKVSQPIIEVLKVEITCEISDTTAGITAGETADFTKFVFEKNVYDVLPIEYDVFPNKGVSLYYELGSTDILGGDFRTPTQSSGDFQNDYAFKKAIYSAFKGYISSETISGNAWQTIYVNGYSFKVTYRTKSDVRQNQSRPDLRKYLLSSKYDKVPQFNQFNNQTDVLVDSEKFGNNVYGKLVRTGNTTYSITEYNTELNNIKHKGELYKINGDNYYVYKAQHLFFADHVISTIEFSKDFNQLSSIVGIPSEPRFYEISEQSSINRDIAINDYIIVSTNLTDIDVSGSTAYLRITNHLSNLLFGKVDDNDNDEFAKYVVLALKGDKDVGKTGDQTRGVADFYKELLLPINAYSSQNTLTYKWETKDNYGAGDMVFNEDFTSSGLAKHLVSAYDNMYRSMRAVQYCDTYGKATLFDFAIVDKLLPDMGVNNIRVMPTNSTFRLERLNITFGGERGGSTTGEREVIINNKDYEDFIRDGMSVYEDLISSPIGELNLIDGTWYLENASDYDEGDTLWCYMSSSIAIQERIAGYPLKIVATNVTDLTDTDYNGRGLSLLKDNRERLRFNYNLQMLTSSDQFVVSPFLFEDKKENVRLVLLNKEVNKLSYGYIDDSSIINTSEGKFFECARNVDSEIDLPYFRMYISTALADISERHFDGSTQYEQVKAIAFVYGVNDESDTNTFVPNKHKFVIARNIPSETSKTEATKDWFVGSLIGNYFTNVQ